MIYLYRIVYSFFKILLLILKPVLGPKMQDFITLRGKEIVKTKNINKSYWFHASSGEIEYCKSVIRLLKQQKPEAQIIVTYSSPSAEKLFYNISEYVSEFLPLPWDQPKAVNKLLEYINPQALIFSKTDLWPELIFQARKQKIKLGVISFSPNSGFVNSWLLPQLDFVHLAADGDTRFDQVFHRLEQPSKIKISTESKVLICGSTWPEDEAVLFKAFQELEKKNIKVILCPHEVAVPNIQRIQKELHRIQITSQLLSNEPDRQNIKIEKNVLIVDEIGVLADAYRFADVAFVGGSFKEKTHSVMEPLCCGLPVITGPHFQNNLEAVRYQGRFVFALLTPGEIASYVEKLLLCLRDEISEEMKKNMHASEKVLKLFAP